MNSSTSYGRQLSPIIPGWFPFALLISVCVILLIIGVTNLSGTEVVLLGVIQTIFSLAAGWLITHAYAKKSELSAIREVEELHQKNLRTFALKAAEKVENLSRELGRLAIYLSQELEEADYESADDELLAKEERIESAIHLLNTLKSVNDTSLSDWRGVIGEEIDEIRLRADQREETLEKLVDKIQRLQEENESREDSVEASRTLIREVDKLRRDLSFVAGGVVGNLWTARKPVASSNKQSMQGVCPCCDKAVLVKIKARIGAKKGFRCVNCNQRLVAEFVGDGQIKISQRRLISEHVDCQGCGVDHVVALDELNGASSRIVCRNCGVTNTITRARSGVIVNLSPPRSYPVTEEVIDRVRSSLPDQPWPKGIHQHVAEKIGVDPGTVRKAISQLILRGVFKDQFQGVLCTPGEKLLLMRSIGKDLD